MVDRHVCVCARMRMWREQEQGNPGVHWALRVCATGCDLRALLQSQAGHFVGGP